MRLAALVCSDMRVKKTDSAKPTDKAPLKMAPAAAANKGPYPVWQTAPTLLSRLLDRLHGSAMPCLLLKSLFVLRWVPCCRFGEQAKDGPDKASKGDDASSSHAVRTSEDVSISDMIR